MATCPHCYEALSERHTCRPARKARPALWRATMTVIGSGCLAWGSMALWPEHVPGIALAAGGALGYAIALATGRPSIGSATGRRAGG